MIAVSLTPATAGPLQPGALATEIADPFAALFAALIPVDAAFPDSAAPAEDATIDPVPDTAPDMAASPEAVLALLAPMPVPLPNLTPADEAIAAPHRLPSRDGVMPAPDRPTPIGPPREGNAAIEQLLPLLPSLALHGAPLTDGPAVKTLLTGDVLLPSEPPPAPNVAELAAAQRPPETPLPPNPVREVEAELMPELPLVAPQAAKAEAVHLPEPARLAEPGRIPEQPRQAELARLPEPVLQPEVARAPSKQLRPRDLAQALPSTMQIAAPATPAAPLMPGSPEPAAVTAQQLAGQIAVALPRLRQSGGEAVLTLDPARLGRVTLSWQAGSGGAPVLTVRAVEPVTATLLARLGDDISAMLRADPALAGGDAADLRLDIGRPERVAETRQTDGRAGDTMSPGLGRDGASDAGQSRHSHRGAAFVDAQTQGWRRDAVNPDDPLDSAAPHSGTDPLRARLA